MNLSNLSDYLLLYHAIGVPSYETKVPEVVSLVAESTCSRTPLTLSSKLIGGSFTPILSAKFCPFSVFTHLN
jgi:hypothetical protein